MIKKDWKYVREICRGSQQTKVPYTYEVKTGKARRMNKTDYQRLLDFILNPAL